MDEAYPLLQLPLWIDLLAIGSGALAGAANALRERFDIIGVLLIAILMGLGGGIIRDLLLGLRPVAVSNQAYLITAVAAVAPLGLAAVTIGAIGLAGSGWLWKWIPATVGRAHP